MYLGVYERGDYVWVRGPDDNFLCIHAGKLVASISSNGRDTWFQVVLQQPKAAITLKDEVFADLDGAMARAEQLVGGTGGLQQAVAALSKVLPAGQRR